MGNQCVAAQPSVMDARARMRESHGDELSKALSELAPLLNNMNDQIFQKPLKHDALVNLGMIVTQCKQEERYTRPLMSGKKFTDMAVLMKAHRFASYARAACKNREEEILKIIEEDAMGGNIQIHHVQMPTGRLAMPTGKLDLAKGRACPGYFIATDKASNEIVLSIRGKALPHDAIHDITTETVPFLEGTTLKKQLASCEELIKQSKEHLEAALQASPDCGLSVVGHGLGAGIAVLATVQAFGEGSAVESLLKKGKVKCYAFSPPPIFEPVGSLLMHRTSAIYSFINGMDCVARASPATLGKLLLAVRSVDDLTIDHPTRLDFLGGDAEEDAVTHKLPDVQDLPEDLGKELKSLSCIGTTILLFKAKDGRMNCEKLVGSGIDRILIHPDMATDYKMESYEESLGEVLVQLQATKGCC